ncbi:MAG: type II secretion system GspH family protein [Acidobacteria bacterium]|nr:type II secretion system GspH family protein [Acidobacteriota bacterium]MCI0721162.1 type II secretion system GspH family protein [Acidobacteriota bacterium]
MAIDTTTRQDQGFEMTITRQGHNPRLAEAKQKGFSLLELLIVLTIMLIVAAVAVPNYMGSRARANEAAAAASVRAIISAQNLYRNTHGNYTELITLGGDFLTDQKLASGSKSGYNYVSDPGVAVALNFSVEATPALSLGPSRTGVRHYYGDESAVVRFNLTGSASSSSPPIQ